VKTTGDGVLIEFGSVVVNITARLEGIAEPGGICIPDDAFRQVRGKIEAEFADIGEQSLKNIARPLPVYSIGRSSATEQPTTPPTALPLPDKPSIAVLPPARKAGVLHVRERFGARDRLSPLEGGGFEPSVPRMRPSPPWPLNLLQP